MTEIQEKEVLIKMIEGEETTREGIEKVEDLEEIGLILGKIGVIKRIAIKEDGIQEVDQDREVDLSQINLGVVSHGMNRNREIVVRVQIIE